MAASPSLGVLPNDLLIPILAGLGAESLPSLVNLGMTCKQLHALVFDDSSEHIWRDVHNRTYDDPRDAAAFPLPRAAHGWRTRVVERAYAVAFLTERAPLFPKDENVWLEQPVWKDPQHPLLANNRDLRIWFNAAPRIFRAVLSLIDDMPPLPTYSKNEALVHALAQTPNLTTLVTTFGALSDDGQRLWALLAHYPGYGLPEWNAAALPSPEDVERYTAGFRGQHQTERPTAWTTFVRAFRRCICASETPSRESQPPKHTGAWSSVLVAADKSRHFLDDDGAARALLLAQNMNDIACLRSAGLPGVAQGYKDGEVWDWANVTGRWCGAVVGMRHYTSSYVLGWEERLVERPGYFTLHAAARDDVAAHAAKFGLPSDETILKDTLAKLSKHKTLPPLFFHGIAEPTPENARVRSPRLFIYGVVGLVVGAPHEPPQISYTMVVRALEASAQYNFVMEGVQLGGRGSKRGVVGHAWPSAASDKDAPRQLKPRPAWVFKVDDWPLVPLAPPAEKSAWEEDTLPPLYERYADFGTRADE